VAPSGNAGARETSPTGSSVETNRQGRIKKGYEMLKKMMLISMVAVLAAFAAPAAASAHLEWYESASPEDATLEGNAELHLVGELATSTPTGFVETLCPVTFAGVGSNSGPEGAAHGVLTGGNINGGGGCETNLSPFGCNVEEVSLNFGANGWTLTTSTPDHVALDNITITKHYNAGCEAFGLPRFIPTAGSLEGTLTNNAGPNGEDCVSFEEAEGLAVEGGGPAVTVDGELCISLPLTLH
jgi:hypothetical protein